MKESDQIAVHRSQTQWALIWYEFRKRRLAVACGVVVLILATVSIFAPFLANDRPICYRGYNRFEYQNAARTLRAVLSQVGGGKAPANAATIMSDRFDEMTANLTPEVAAELGRLKERALELARTQGADDRLRTEARRLRNELRSRFDAGKVELGKKIHWPVVASLRSEEIAFMTFNLLLLLFPVWRLLVTWLLPPGRPLARAWAQTGVLFLVPLLCASAWHLAVPERVDRTDYKAGVFTSAGAGDGSEAPVVYDSVTWPLIPYGLDEDDLTATFLPPGGRSETQKAWAAPHWMGTDGIGRDVLSRMIWGGRVSLAVGVVAVSIYVTIGIIVGSIAGYFRGAVDLIISRVIEIVICFPYFFLILTVVAFVGPSIFNIMLVIGVIGWTGVARLVRGEFLRLSGQEFVLAGRALGFSPARIIFRHVLPNALAPVLVSATFGIAGAILTESALSFLGFGITVPKPSWGGILASGREAIFRAPWLIYFPGLAIFLTITSYNLVGEALRDAADPRLRGQHIK